MASWPQANGTVERMLQNLTRALVTVDQKDWDSYPETLALLSTHLKIVFEKIRRMIWFLAGIQTWHSKQPHRWGVISDATWVRGDGGTIYKANISAQVLQWMTDSKPRYRTGLNDMRLILSHSIKRGSHTWLYMDRVKTGYARKQAHMWHGPFRIAEVCGEHVVRLKIAGTPYQLLSVVHISNLKRVRRFPDLPEMLLEVDEPGRFSFDEAMLPEDS